MTDNKSNMSFKEFLKLQEAGIVPPSGMAVGKPTTTVKPTSGQQPPASAGPNAVKSIWPGQGAPVEIGMTVGLTDPTGKSLPGTVSQVDKSANGVKVKNPTTGKDEWMNIDALSTFMDQSTGMQEEINRLRKLAGIKEMSSAGATGAGAIAVAPAAMGSVKKRQPATEAPKKEYVPKSAAKTVVGDTKPNQASGELSATLAANGKKTASRTNNGFKK